MTNISKMSRLSGLLGTIALSAHLGCSSSDAGSAGAGAPGSAGAAPAAAGATASAGSVGHFAGSPSNGGSPAGVAGGVGLSGAGGASTGAAGSASTGTAGSASVGGAAGGIGSGGAAGSSGGTSAGGGGTTGGATGFDPCPATGDCKVLAMGDSITFGTPTNNGGYRVELFTKALTDGKHLTFVAGKTDSSSGPTTGKTGPSAPPDGPTTVKINGADVMFPRANEGYPGIITADLDARRCANGNGFTNMPNIVLLHTGTNDMVGSNAGGAPAALGKIIDDIAAAAPNALIAVAAIIPLKNGNAAVLTYNATIPGIVQMKASAGKHVIFVDQYTDFPTSELTDGVHPTDTAGYPRMGDKWYDAIKSYLH